MTQTSATQRGSEQARAQFNMRFGYPRFPSRPIADRKPRIANSPATTRKATEAAKPKSYKRAPYVRIGLELLLESSILEFAFLVFSVTLLANEGVEWQRPLKKSPCKGTARTWSPPASSSRPQSSGRRTKWAPSNSTPYAE